MTTLEWVSALHGKRQGTGGQYIAKCPAHDDKHASLSIGSDGNGNTLLCCHAGCTAEEIVAAVGKTTADLYADAQQKKVHNVEAQAVYSYHDVTGKILLEKKRFPGKSFLWYRDEKPGIGKILPALYCAFSTAVQKADTVLWVEGEKDADTLNLCDHAAVCLHSGAAGKPTPEQLEVLREKKIIILPDNDKPGRDHAQNVAKALQGIASSVRVIDLTTIDPQLKDKGDITDLVEDHDEGIIGTILEKAEKTAEWSGKRSSDAEPQTPRIIFYDSVEYEEPQFLFKPYIPLGKITIIQADSGVGKTALACKLAACVSQGMMMETVPCEQGNVLILSVEDDPSTLRGRIDASGGDVSKCAFLENAYQLSFTSPEIESIVTAHNVKLVIFDPLQAFLGNLDMHRANETRPVMAHLAAMAKRTNSAIIIISHMSKSSAGGKAIYRALGSVDIPAASRSVLYVERNPHDVEQCVIVHIKSSNAKNGQSVLYRIGERGGVQWEGYSSITMDDLIIQAERREKGVNYEDEPIVIGARAYIAENPKGGKLTYDDFHTVCVEVSGIAPYPDNREAAYRIPRIKAELMMRDRILIETGAYVNRSKGISITPYEPSTAFQTRFATEATQT